MLSRRRVGLYLSCSHPEPSATILEKTRISRPQRKPGGHHVTVHSLITWLTCNDHVADHALITWLIMN